LNLSPLEEYCAEIDSKHPDKTYMWLYWNVAMKVAPKYFTTIFLKDMKYRAEHQKNVVASAEGQQGCGKSLFSICLATILAVLFTYPFDIYKDLFTNPAELDSELHSIDTRRRTFIYDEQPQRIVGTGSRSTQIGLKDYEEICRYTQNNLIYCSPNILEHAHYFVFKQVEFDPPRVTNKKCDECSNFAKCQQDFYKTLCDIPFYERAGYPKRFNFMLETKRLADKTFVPRGIVSLPMIPHELATKYNEVKAKNIKKFENYEDDVLKNQLLEMKKFVEENEKDLIRKDKQGNFIPKKRGLLRIAFKLHFGKGRFVTDEVEDFLDIVRQSLLHVCETLNNDEDV